MSLDLLVVTAVTAVLLPLLLAECTPKAKKPRNNDCKTTLSTGEGRTRSRSNSVMGAKQRGGNKSNKSASLVTALDSTPSSTLETVKPTSGMADKNSKVGQPSRSSQMKPGVEKKESQKKAVERKEDATQEDGDGPNDFELKAYSEGTILDPRLVKRFKLVPGVEKPMDVAEFKNPTSPPDDARVSIDPVGYLYETEDPTYPEDYIEGDPAAGGELEK